MGLGLIFSALSSGGNAFAASEKSQQDVRDQEKMLQERADLEEQKAKNLAQFNNNLQNAPLDRAGALISAASGQSVPVTAAPVTQLSGNELGSQGMATSSSGAPVLADGAIDASKTKPSLAQYLAAAAKLPDNDPNKADLIAQLTQQQSAAQKSAQDAVAGQTRKPTTQEAMQTAFQNAMDSGKAGDYRAALAIKSAIPDRLTILPDGATAFDNVTGKLIFSNGGKEERMQIHDDNVAARQKLLFQQQIDMQEKKAASAAAANNVDPAIAKKIANYEVDIQSRNQASRDAHITAALAFNPDYNSGNFSSIKKVNDDFQSGPSSQKITSLNRVAQHAQLYLQLADAQNNGDVRLLNDVKARLKEQFGQSAPTTIAGVGQALAGELNNTIVTGPGGEGERKDWRSLFAAKNSPEQAHDNINNAVMPLLQGQVKSLEQKYVSVNGGNQDLRLEQFKNKLVPDARSLFYGDSGKSSQSMAPITAPSIATPNVLNYDPKTGTFH